MTAHPNGSAMKMNVFTYGSLMFEPVWRQVVGKARRRRDARICGFKRRKVRGEIYPAIVPASSRDCVEGKLYLDVDPEDLARLDEFEGCFYRKERVRCDLKDGTTAMAWVYVFGREYRNLIENEDWDPDRFEQMVLRSFLNDDSGLR